MGGSDEADGWIRDAAGRLYVLDPTSALALLRAAREVGRTGSLLDLLEGRAMFDLGRLDDAARLAGRAAADVGATDPDLLDRAAWVRALATAGSDTRAATRTLRDVVDGERLASVGDRALVRADLAVLEARQGRREEAEILLGDAVDLLLPVADTVGVVRVLFRAADARLACRDPSTAAEALRDAAARLGEAREETLLVQLWWRQATVALELGDPRQGLLLARRALSRAGQDAHQRGVLWGLVARAHEATGDASSALAAWRKSAELLDGSPESLNARAEEAAVLARLGRLIEVREQLPEWCDLAERMGARATIRFHALLLVVAANDRDRASWSHHWRHVVARAADPDQLDARLAEHLRLAAGLSSDDERDVEHAPHPLSRAVRAHALALDVWQRIGRSQEAVRQSRALHELGSRGAPIPAGPFDLTRRIGRGAVGDVWRARHHDRRLVVAVKVLAHQDPRMRASFDTEVRAAASLDHPNIVRVVGTGILGPEAEAVGHGEVRVESPWCAMELAEGGTLDSWCGRLPWSQVKAVVLSLLDALAHAHARGVVHLDLKPSNVLLRTRDGGVVLSDFGLAKVVELQHGRTTVAGTPQYMAPEQFRGDSRDYGPWTDLYALGCLVVHLVTGAPPFAAETIEGQRLAHLEAALPTMVSRVPVPVGLDGWISRLMEKDPAERFQRAADAAWALSHLQDPADGPPLDDLPPKPFRSRTWTLSLHSLHDEEPSLPQGIAPVGAERPRPGQHPPCPDDWRTVSHAAAVEDFADVALSLVGLRRPPLVGREAERDQLWGTLLSVARGDGPRMAVLRGPSGCGKSVLSRWLGERAHEVGAAIVLDATPGPDGRAGLQAAVGRYLRLEGLGLAAAQERIHHAFPELPEPVVEDLAILVVEHGIAMSPAERVGAVVAFAAGLAAGRVLLVRLEPGAPADADQLLLARMLVASGGPVLVVAEEVGEPLPLGEVDLLSLAPMSERDLLALLDAMVPLEHAVRARLAELCGDNPDLLVRTLQRLVDADAFQRGSDGWQLRPGVPLALPWEVAEQWAGRVAAILGRLPRPVRAVLVGAAFLGRALTEERLVTVCEALGTELATVLAASRELLDVGPTGVPRWEHPAVPAVLREGFPDLAAAQAAAEATAGQVGVEALHATLLVRSGRLREAVEPLLLGAEACLREGDPVRALELLDRRARILTTMGLEAPAAEVPDALLRARIAGMQGADDAETLAAIAVALASRYDAHDALAEALLVKARRTAARGDLEVARAEIRRAIDAFATVGDVDGTGRALREAGDLALLGGDVASALSLHARAVSRITNDPVARGSARAALAETLRQTGDLVRAREEACAALDEVGSARSAARSEAMQVLADVDRTSGDIDGAESWYRAVLASLPWHDANRIREVQLRRAMLRVAIGRFAEARVMVDGLLAAHALESGSFVGRCRLVELVVLARSDDRTWMAQLELVRRWVELCERDVAWLLDQAGQRTTAAGKLERSGWLFARAAAGYARLGLDRERDVVERRAATLRRAR
ncbi:MAG: protein kinase [Alphaproteobacteria bacterium]|nr:protein kinase [Alphaproteobacteria bacterium]